MDRELSKRLRVKRATAKFSAARKNEHAVATQDEAELLRQKLAEITLLFEVIAKVNLFLGRGKNFEHFFV